MLIHTGQHYNGPMSDAFFANLELPDRDVNLHLKSAGAIAQIAEIMLRLEPVLAESGPDLVVGVSHVQHVAALQAPIEEIEQHSDDGAAGVV